MEQKGLEKVTIHSKCQKRFQMLMKSKRKTATSEQADAK